MDEGLSYSANFDLMLESNYPYTGLDGTCQWAAGKGAGFKNTSHRDIGTDA